MASTNDSGGKSTSDDALFRMSRRRERAMNALRKAQACLAIVYNNLSEEEDYRNRTLLMNAWSKLHLSKNPDAKPVELKTRILFCHENPDEHDDEDRARVVQFARLTQKYPERKLETLLDLGSCSLHELEALFASEGVPLTPAFRLFLRFFQEEMSRCDDRSLLPTDWSAL